MERRQESEGGGAGRDPVDPPDGGAGDPAPSSR